MLIEMQLAACLLSVLIVVLESYRCSQAHTISTALIASVFNIAFLHIWMVLDLCGYTDNMDVSDDRVVQYILFSDIAWLFMAVMMDGIIRTTVPVKVASMDATSVTLLFLISFGVGAIYLSQVGVSILAEDVEWARHTSKKGHGYYNIFITRGALLSAGFAYVLYLAKEIHLWKAATVIFLVVALQFATGFRTYVLTTALMLWLCRVNMSRTYKLRSVIFTAVWVLGIFSWITAYKAGVNMTNTSIGTFGEAIWPYIHHRIVMEVPRVTWRILMLVDIEGPLWGLSYWWDAFSALPGPGYSLGDRLFIWFGTGQEIAGIAPIPAGLIGEAAINFTGYGVPFVVCVYYWMMRKVDMISETGIVAVVFKSVMTVFMAECVSLGIGLVLVSRVLPLVAFMLVFYMLQSLVVIVRKAMRDILVRRPSNLKGQQTWNRPWRQ